MLSNVRFNEPRRKQALIQSCSATKVPRSSKYASESLPRPIGHVTHSAKELARKAEISNDHFIRTTDREHKDAVEYAWVRRIETEGHTYVLIYGRVC